MQGSQGAGSESETEDTKATQNAQESAEYVAMSTKELIEVSRGTKAPMPLLYLDAHCFLHFLLLASYHWLWVAHMPTVTP